MTKLEVTVVGAGVLGLWQALVLARRGHRVTLREAAPAAAAGAASRYAGAMLAPDCEAEPTEPHVRELGRAALPLWREACPEVVCRGTLVLAASRDRSELARFARLTAGHREVGAETIAELEPEFAGRFGRGLFYAEECHLAPRPALQFLVHELGRLGVELRFEAPVAGAVRSAGAAGGAVIDCRGIAARADLPTLRGVRGEMLVLRTDEVRLGRPVRLLHPRHPLYVVPWGAGRYMVGATVIERDDAGPVTARSALELLGLAYALHPAFGEAEIVEMGAGVRPAFPDNMPRALVRGRTIHVNGAYRHGFLLAPVLAAAVADFLDTGEIDPRLVAAE